MTNESVQPVTKGDLAGLEERLGERLKAKASIGDLDALGQRLEKNIGVHIESAVETLARITKDGFDAVDKRFDGVDRRLDTLDRGQEDIHMRLAEVAYKIDVTDLTRRVDKIEHKVGISSV